MKKPYKLTEYEISLFTEGATNPSVLSNYWFRPEGAEKGWIFDENFDPDGAWQETVHLASQTDICVVGGFGSGKTSGVAVSAGVWCISVPWFKFLNVAEKAWQAKQMYDYLIVASSGTPFEKLIWSKPQRPYHKIVLRFQIGEAIVESTLEFMSVDEDATGILSWEGDWINVEEAALLNNLEEIVTSVGSRLRGSVRGRPRLGRLSFISNSRYNDYFWYYFDLAKEDPEGYLSLICPTDANHNITPEQLKKMIARVPENERAQLLKGERPEGKGGYFSSHTVIGCEDIVYGEFIVNKYNEPDYNYLVETKYGVGIVAFETPKRTGHIYIVIGDPGTDNAPRRNSPPIMVWDVPADFPNNPAYLAAFWWGSGNGKISPFVNKTIELRDKYSAIVTAIDSTGPQANMAEIVNIQYLGNEIENGDSQGIVGLDFSGTKKMGYLVVLRMFLEAKLMRWPQNIVGIRAQLTNYEPEDDKTLAQDIVATMAMSAWVMRNAFNVDLDEVALQRLGQNRQENAGDFGTRLPPDSRISGRQVREIPPTGR
jgi:hypothetical protein